jgi:4-alpha-glucanotransferase
VPSTRRVGLLAPLFAIPSSRSWGIGEIADLVPFCAWLREAGCGTLLMLPVNEMAGGGHSPYSALSAQAIDPLYISLWALDDHVALGAEQGLGAETARALAAVRASRRIDYDEVRRLKGPALRAAFRRFLADEWRQETARAAAFHDFRVAEAWWLDDYALFRALKAAHLDKPWWEWDAGLAAREPEALARARADLHDEVLYRQYLQWVATSQWQAARRRVAPVTLLGDLPFMVGRDSADVWARQHAFDTSATVGTPPDAFSETGQDWGLPAYRWDVFAAEGDVWLRERARRAAELFAGFRVDHLVGFYRTYVIPAAGGERRFAPASEAAQRAQGERLMAVFREPGAEVIAEDLGTVPAFVRASLVRLGIPGYRVLRWERHWDRPGQPFLDPVSYPPVSVATTGTHDTETLAEWWETAPAAERRALARVPSLLGRSAVLRSPRYSDEVRDTLLELMFASGSDLLILPVQDVFGWRDRINTPATVGDDNWTWRLPWVADTLRDQPAAVERAARLRGWAAGHGRALP